VITTNLERLKEWQVKITTGGYLQQAQDEITWRKKSDTIHKPETPSQAKIYDKCMYGITGQVKVCSNEKLELFT